MSHCAQLDEVPAEASVSISVVRALIASVEKAGVSRLQLLRTSHIGLEQLEDAAARVSLASVYRLCEAALELTRDPALGLHWAEGLGSHSFGPISLLMAHAPTLRHALEALSTYHRLLVDRLDCQRHHDASSVLLGCPRLARESLRMQRFAAEMSVAGMYKIVRAFGVPADSVQVHFDYAAPSYRAEYVRVFDGAARFEQPSSGVVFDRRFMSLASPHMDNDVYESLRSIAERRVWSLTRRTPYAERARDVLLQPRAHRPASMPAVAHALGLSVRSLRRHLASEGRSYRSVMDEVFAILATHRLRSTQRTIQEIAFELGFSNTSAFHRAFKRRLGMTPKQYRARQLVD